MAKVKVLNITGEEVGSLTLKDDVWGNDYNESLIHEVIVAYLANQRQGTKSTLSRSEVRGHAKKPWRQKHTGRARHGSTKAPQWTGGGVVFAPKPRDFSKKVNKQAKKIAFYSALSQKLALGEIIVLDNIAIAEPKTKVMATVLKNLNCKGKTCLVTATKDDIVLRASANIDTLEITNSSLLNTYEVVASRKLVITKDAIKKIEEAYVK